MDLKDVKPGDIVRRITGGTHGGIKVGDTFVVEAVHVVSVDAPGGYHHNCENLEFVRHASGGEPIINNLYPIY